MKTLHQKTRKRSRHYRRRSLQTEQLEARNLLTTAIGGEFAVNSTTTGSQFAAAAARDLDGGFAVVWDSLGQDGDGHGLFAQRFNADGTTEGTEFQVNTTTAGDQLFADLAMNAGGELVVAWESGDADGSGIFAQRYAADGTNVGSEFAVNSTTVNDQLRPSVGLADDGRFIVVWVSVAQDGDSGGIFGQRYDADGQPDGVEFQINSTSTGGQFLPDVAMAGDGRSVVAWESDGQDGDSRGIFGQRYDADGSAAGSEFSVNVTTDNEQSLPAVAINADGSFAITWDGVVLGQHLVFARAFDAAAATPSAEVQVTSTPANLPFVPDVAIDADGQFTVVWDVLNGDGAGDAIRARNYRASATPQGAAFRVNTTTADDQSFPAIAMDGADNFVVVWQSFGQDGSGDGVFGQRFFSNDPALLDLNGPQPGKDFESFYFPQDPLTVIVGDQLSIFDEDHDLLDSAEARFDANLDGTNEILAVDTAGTSITASYDGAEGVLTLAGTETLAAYQQVLRTLSYRNDLINPTTGSRLIEVTVNDGFDDSVAATATVNVESTNDPPSVDLNGIAPGEDFSTVFVEDAGPVPLVSADASLTDDDGATLVAATFTMVNLLDGTDELLEVDVGGTTITATYDAVNGVLSLNGAAPVATYQVVLRTLTYDNASQAPNVTDRIVELVFDDGNSTNAPVRSTVAITPVNDAPEVDLNGAAAGVDVTVTFVEDAGAIGLATEVVIDDIDNLQLQSATATLRPRPDGSDESLDVDLGTSGLVSQYEPASGILTLSGEASLAAYQQVLGTLTYDNLSNDPFFDDRLVEVLVNDGVAESQAATATITLQGTNDPPLLDINGAASGNEFSVDFQEGDPPVFVTAADLTLDDPDNLQLVAARAVLAPRPDGDNEGLDADPGSTGLQVSYDSTTGELSINGTASVEAYEEVLRSVVYDNTSENPDATVRQVTLIVNDGANESLPVTTTVNVIPVNDAPVVDLNGAEPGLDFAVTFEEDGDATFLADVDLQIDDVDNSSLASATAVLSPRPDGDAESLMADPGTTNIAASYDAGTGTLMLVGDATLVDYEQVLLTLAYHNTSQNPTTAARLVTVTVNDGNTESNQATSTVTVLPVNDAPSLDLNGAAAGIDFETTFREDDGAVFLAASDLLINDPDNLQLIGATAAVETLLDGPAEKLLVDTSSTNINADYDESMGILTLTGSATLAEYEQVLATLSYDNSSEDPTSGRRTVNVTVNDGTQSSPVATAGVDVIPTNDPPVVDLNGAATGVDAVSSFREDDGPVSIVDDELVITDVDGTLLVSSTAQLQAIPDGTAESLTVDPGTSGITSEYDADSGLLTLTGSAPLSDYEAVLATLSYENSSQNPNTQDRVVTVIVNDGSDQSDPARSTISVVAVNDPPEVDLNGSDPGNSLNVTLPSDAIQVLLGGPDVEITDVDDDTLNGSTITLADAADGSDEFLKVDTDGTPITATYDPTTFVLTLEGTASLEQYEQVLRTLCYTNSAPARTAGPRTVTVSLDDGTTPGSTPAVIDVELAGDFGTIAGSVYADVNNDGTRGPREVGLPNVPIMLTGPVDATVVTDGDGIYRFPNLPPGEYTLQQQHPTAFVDGMEQVGQPGNGEATEDGFQRITVTPGTTAGGYDFLELGLRSDFATKQLLLSSTPPANIVAGAIVLEPGDWYRFATDHRGTIRVRAEAESLSRLEVYSSDVLPLALPEEGVASVFDVEPGKSYFVFATAEGETPIQLHFERQVAGFDAGSDSLLDVNQDGQVTPLDALEIINLLNGDASERLTATRGDVSGDGAMSPVDVLLVINRLNLPSSPEWIGLAAEAELTEGEKHDQALLATEPWWENAAWLQDDGTG